MPIVEYRVKKDIGSMNSNVARCSSEIICSGEKKLNLEKMKSLFVGIA